MRFVSLDLVTKDLSVFPLGESVIELVYLGGRVPVGRGCFKETPLHSTLKLTFLKYHYNSGLGTLELCLVRV